MLERMLLPLFLLFIFVLLCFPGALLLTLARRPG